MGFTKDFNNECHIKIIHSSHNFVRLFNVEPLQTYILTYDAKLANCSVCLALEILMRNTCTHYEYVLLTYVLRCTDCMSHRLILYNLMMMIWHDVILSFIQIRSVIVFFYALILQTIVWPIKLNF